MRSRSLRTRLSTRDASAPGGKREGGKVVLALETDSLSRFPIISWCFRVSFAWRRVVGVVETRSKNVGTGPRYWI